VLAIIGVALLGGGGYLISLGGSAYYAVAGLVVGICAILVARGDARGRALYAVLLIGTVAWALWERGLNPWALQARVFAPLVLGLWVFWPVLRRWPRTLSAAAVAAVAAFVWLMAGGADPDVKPSAPGMAADNGPAEWHAYGNDIGGKRYSVAAQITPDNVGELHEAWSIHAHPATLGLGFEATPLFVKDTLYLCTSAFEVIALDPDTGERKWTFDPKADLPKGPACRGVAYYAVPNATGHCAERIILAITDARLAEVDRNDGAPCDDFGTGGFVDLKPGLGDYPKGYWRTTSAPAVVRGKIVFGSFILDGQYVGEPSGVIRAYDAVTGTMAWAWDMDHEDRKGEPPAGETYSLGTANSWGTLSGDEALGLVYLPMGNSTPDYWGAHRSAASEKYASSVVALDVETGDVRWHFQTVHHDLWDYDVSAQPVLVDLPVDGQTVPALIQGTKRGQVFVLDRRTGTPLIKVEEVPVPQGPAEGDFLSPTQPYSTGMPAFDLTVWTEAMTWGTTPIDQLWCRIKFREARYEGQFTPPGIKPTIFNPAYVGGINWGSVAVDPERRRMVVNWSRMANYARLVPRAEADKRGIKPMMDNGANDMGAAVSQSGTPFALETDAFWSPLHVPCTEPPFGKITVVDLDSKQTAWERVLGTSRDIGPFETASHIPLPMGVPSAGGSIVTKSGLIFIAATQERTFRAFDIRDGRKLWSARLPAGGQATPMTFVSPKTGRQYVVIAAGGNFTMRSKQGDYVVAYALK
jgi:quinoprotein glucose dehydrogenase